MRYEGDLYSPHIQGDDFILQCTIGCSHNKCTFCYMYKNKQYRVRPLHEIIEDIDAAKGYYGDVTKVFLADGDALNMPIEQLLTIVDYLYNTFAGLQYIGTYATAASILAKTPAELTQLKNHGLVEIHLGVESGDEEVLRAIRKGVSREEMIQAGRKIRQAGLQLFITVILGLAGSKTNLWAHAKHTAQICNEIQPDYIGLLTIMVQPGTELYETMCNGQFLAPEDMEILEEMYIMIEAMKLEHTGITSVHPSNCIDLEGLLPDDKDRILQTLSRVIKNRDMSCLRSRKTERV
ncbi:MAG: B12-binding domain-containing radical SAM protein [Sporomusa sp.]